MTYRVLARKWRPRTFDDVVGQEHVVTALRNALAEDRIAQAYLFSGIRGVGKTSVARIFACALNGRECAEDDAVGGDLDILEVDAATHSKVEQARELTESLRYKPVHGRYKVVVLDEVHRLSRQAFDALLKIVEEPPPHLVFIFATTEVEAVPATILSRCQEFTFRRVPFGLVVEHLAKVAAAEEIEVGDKALRLIARAGEGSVRDSVALLDQLATFGSGEISDQETARLLGGADTTLHHRLLAAICRGEPATVREVAAAIEADGRDPRHVFGEFLSYTRDGLHLSLGGEVAQVELPDEEARELAELARQIGYESLLRLLHLLLASEEAVRRSESGMLAVEIAWLRAAELPKLTRIEQLLGGGTPAAGDAERSPSPAPGAGSAPPPPAREAGSAEPTAPDPVVAPPPAPPAAAAAQPSEQGVARFLEALSRQKPALASHFTGADALALRDGRLVVYSSHADLLEKTLARNNNRQILESCLEEGCGRGTELEILEEAAPESASGVAAGTTDETSDPTVSHPTVQAALQLFGGRVESIEDDTSLSTEES